MYMVDVKNRFGVEQLRNMGWGNAARPQLRPLNDENVHTGELSHALHTY